MIKVTFHLQDGTTKTVEVSPGTSIKDAAEHSMVPGILGLCGGACMCGTCHVYLDPAWRDCFAPPSEGEELLLQGVAAERREGSRLSCQLRLEQEMDGIVVTMPVIQQ